MKVEYIKESKDRELVDTYTGEVFNQQVSYSKKTIYYNIKKLNVKVSFMDIMETMESVCKSSKDIYIFGKILSKADRLNEIRINISSYSKDIGVTRQQVTTMFKRMVDSGMLKRIEKGVYLANPFIYKAKGCTSETIEMLQKTYKKENNERINNKSI